MKRTKEFSIQQILMQNQKNLHYHFYIYNQQLQILGLNLNVFIGNTRRVQLSYKALGQKAPQPISTTIHKDFPPKIQLLIPTNITIIKSPNRKNSTLFSVIKPINQNNPLIPFRKCKHNLTKREFQATLNTIKSSQPNVINNFQNATLPRASKLSSIAYPLF